MSLHQVIEQYHRAADEFSRGNPEPVKMIFSHRDDVTLANPFAQRSGGGSWYLRPSTLRHLASEMVR
jgi:hypothetical protein